MRKIVIEDAVKKFKDVVALAGVSFEIYEKEVFGFVGPNGAGKTTMIESILGLRKLDSGSITIFGKDSRQDHAQVVRMVGAQLQECEIASNMKVREAVQLQAAAFGVKIDIDEYLAEFNLLEKKNAFLSKLSGGQKKRLFILLSIVHNPAVLFFDEPSTGLDPISRQEVWRNIMQLKREGKTVILSTHMMDEAEELCNRIVLINKGRIVNVDAPRNLIKSLPYTAVIEFFSSESLANIAEALQNLEGANNLRINAQGLYCVDAGPEIEPAALQETLAAHGVEASNFRARQTNLEDYFHYAVNQKLSN